MNYFDTKASRAGLSGLLLFSFACCWVLGFLPGFRTCFFAVIVLFTVSAAILFVCLPCRESFAGVIISLTTVCIMLAAVDLLLRSMGILYYRPHERFVRLHPDRPFLLRYAPDIHSTMTSYGDLANMARDRELRVKRRITFHTDEDGFCNNRNAGASETGFDVLVLADSFALPTSTSQEKTWPALFQSKYRLAVYNLAQVGNPFDNYVNFQLEHKRLKMKPGASVILMIFTGNDLMGNFPPVMDVTRLNSNTKWESFRQNFCSMRNRSPLRNLFASIYYGDADKAQAADVIIRNTSAGRLAFFRPYMEESGRSFSDVTNHPNFKPLVAAITGIHSLANTMNARLRLVVMPTKEEVYDWILGGSVQVSQSGTSVAISNVCSEAGIDFYDLKQPLHDLARSLYAGEGALLWWNDDTHLNERGHAAVADLLHNHSCPVE